MAHAPHKGVERGWPHWTTPRAVVDLVLEVGPIGLDPCANPDSIVPAKVRLDGSPGRNGLRWSWLEHGLTYVNPPFGREAGVWAAKASLEAGGGAEIVWLAPARTDTEWFHKYILGAADAICFWRGRIAFGNPPPDWEGTVGEDSLATGVAIAYFGTNRGAFLLAFRGAGFALDLRRGRADIDAPYGGAVP